MRKALERFKVGSAARIINLFFQEFHLAIKVSRCHNKARRSAAADIVSLCLVVIYFAESGFL